MRARPAHCSQLGRRPRAWSACAAADLLLVYPSVYQRPRRHHRLSSSLYARPDGAQDMNVRGVCARLISAVCSRRAFNDTLSPAPVHARLHSRVCLDYAALSAPFSLRSHARVAPCTPASLQAVGPLPPIFHSPPVCQLSAPGRDLVQRLRGVCCALACDRARSRPATMSRLGY